MDIGQCESGGYARKAVALTLRQIQFLSGIAPCLLDKEKIAPQTAQLTQEEPHIRTLRQKFAYQHGDARGIMGGQSRKQTIHDFLPGKPKDLARHAGGKSLARSTAQRQYLTEQAHGVAHGTGGAPGNKTGGLLFKGAAFTVKDMADMRFQRGFGYLAEHEMLAPAHDGHRELMLFRCGEYESHSRRRLFQRLEQSVEGLLGEHMRFVDDENLIAAFERSIAHGIAQTAYIVDSSVGSAVYFHHVHKRALSDAAAGFALVAGFARRGVLTVQRLGKNAGNGGFTHAARTAEQVGRSHAVFPGGAREYGLHHVLPHHFGESLRAVQSRQRSICCHRISSAPSAVQFRKSLKSLRPAVFAVKRMQYSKKMDLGRKKVLSPEAIPLLSSIDAPALSG